MYLKDIYKETKNIFIKLFHLRFKRFCHKQNFFKAAEQNSQICAALFYKSDVLRNDILIHKELNKNIFFLQDILMPRIYVKCKNCLNFKYIKGKKLMKVMILPNNSILEYVRFFIIFHLIFIVKLKIQIIKIIQ